MDSSKKPSSFGPTVAMMSKVTLGIEIANSFPLGIHDGRAAACLSIEQRRDYSVSPVYRLNHFSFDISLVSIFYFKYRNSSRLDLQLQQHCVSGLDNYFSYVYLHYAFLPLLIALHYMSQN